MNDQDHESKAPNGAPKRPAADADAELIADRLAAAAAPPWVAAGAADLEAGRAVCVDLLAHSLASSHNVLMRFAIAANTVMDWPRIKADLNDPAPPTVHYTARSDIDRSTAADLAAARAAGSAGRVLDFVRLALVAWGARRPATVEDEQWQGLAWANFQCDEADVRRKLAAAKAAKAACDAAQGRGEQHLSPDGRQLQRDAVWQSAELAREAEAAVLADRVAAPGGGAFMRRLFAHELAAIHGLKMRLDGGAVRALDRAVELSVDPVMACRLAEAAARAGDRYRRGMSALDLFDKGSGGAPTEPNTFWVGPDGGYIPPGPHGSPGSTNDNMPPAPKDSLLRAAGEGGERQRAGGGSSAGHLARRSASREPTPPKQPLRLRRPEGGWLDRPLLYATDPALRRGRLNNGNPSGDFLAAPRCGARARHGGACRQPAMASPRGGGGRCRFHGGKSTGPRTADGLARARAARLGHGGYSAEIIDLRKSAAFQVRQLRALIAALKTQERVRHGAHGEPREGAVAPSKSKDNQASSVPSVSSVVDLPGHRRASAFIGGQNPCPAGHGVDRRAPSSAGAAGAFMLSPWPISRAR